MNNAEIARIFDEIAGLLELKGENVFKIRAYQKVVRALEHLPVSAEQLVKEGKVREIPGVGEAIEAKITELVTTGKLDYYEKLKAGFPEGVSRLLEIPGIGPKTAMLLATELGIKTVDELEAAIIDGKVARLYRMGDKTADNILRQIQQMRRKDRRLPIGEVLPVVDDIIDQLKVPGLQNLVPAGSVRRFRETIRDIDIMGTADDAGPVIEAFVALPNVRMVVARGGTKASVLLAGGLQVDLRIVEHDSFGSLLQYFTGSQQHNVSLRERARRRGLSLSEYGITDLATGKLEKFATEADFYARQGLAYIPPELREGQHEIERAEQNTLPDLIQITDIKGDLHAHTDWSDGRDSIEAMALAAKERGYQYLAITDHSLALGIARGLSKERLEQQIAEIRALNEKLDGIRILAGAEVDIRADGSLSVPDEILRELDVVIASLHSGLYESTEQITGRLLRTLENSHVDIIGHPTARQLPGREPVAVDLEAVLKTAARTGTMLEINALPSRLDLRDVNAYRARELGIKLVINTDAHAAEHLDFMRYGIGVARRAWCQAGDIMNTRPPGEMLAYLKGRGR